MKLLNLLLIMMAGTRVAASPVGRHCQLPVREIVPVF
jgi:hypothetical protein